MSRRQYRRNGTPIGKYKVYALAFNGGARTQAYEIIPSGIETYEDLESLVMLEMIEGKFGAPDRLVITKPGVDLGHQDLYNIDMRGVDLSGANLRGADLRLSNLSRSNLRGADISEAHLDHADIEGAELKGAILTKASLLRVKIADAIHAGADFGAAYYPFGKAPAGWYVGYCRLYRR
jgi:hypothetical protein